MSQQSPQSLTKPIGAPATARGSGAAGTAPINQALVLNSAEKIQALTLPTLEKLRRRIGMLAQAARAAGVPLEGADLTWTRFPISPREILAVKALHHGMQAQEPKLELAVQTIFNRFQRAGQTLAAVSQGLSVGQIDRPLLEELKLASFFLSRVHEFAKVHPALASLFPLPHTVAAGSVGAPTTRLEALPFPTDPRVVSGEILQFMEPRIEVVRLIVAMLDPTAGMKMIDIMSGPARKARTIAAAIRRDKALQGQLWDLNRLHAQLLREHQLGGRPEQLAKLNDPIVTHLRALCRHADLAEVFDAESAPRFL